MLQGCVKIYKSIYNDVSLFTRTEWRKLPKQYVGFGKQFFRHQPRQSLKLQLDYPRVKLYWCMHHQIQNS